MIFCSLESLFLAERIARSLHHPPFVLTVNTMTTMTTESLKKSNKPSKPAGDELMMNAGTLALPEIVDEQTAFSHIPEHGFSLFLAKRTKLIHFVRHAEGIHNAANHDYGDETPTIYSTEGSWKYQDAPLTDHGIEQCQDARKTLLTDVNPQLVVVSPFTRTLQTAHILFANRRIPFMVHWSCRERAGKYTCDKMRPKEQVIAEMKPVFDHTHEDIDFESFG